MKLKIFAFTWNTQTIRYNLDKGPSADFIVKLCEKIGSEYDLVVIGLQEDSMKDSPLLQSPQNLIVNELQTNYKLLKLVELSGWGVTTYKALRDDWEYRPRGLRLAILANNEWLKDHKDISIDISQDICPGIRNIITSGKGSVAISLNINGIGKIVVLNVHLPYYSSTMNIDNKNFIQEQYESMLWKAKCFKNIYEKVVSKHNPDYVLLMGDLNFRVQLRKETNAIEITEQMFETREYLKELVKEGDELRLLFSYAENEYTIPSMKEGINNEGPQFYPTAKLKRGRRSSLLKLSDYKLGKENQRIPSWCDRILYQSLNSDGKITCNFYERWDKGNMNQSDHCSVMGEYIITKN